VSNHIHPSKNLVLLTATYPYGNGESFLENEIEFLAQKFNRILIVSRAKDTLKQRQLPENVSVYNVKLKIGFSQKLKSFKYLFHREFFNERSAIEGKWFRVKVSLISLQQAVCILRFVHSIVKQENLLADSLVFYSYWWDDAALAAIMLKKDFSGSKAFCRAHRWDLYTEENPENYLPYRKETAEKLDKIFVISEQGLQYITNKIPTGNFALSRLGTMPRIYKKPDESEETLHLLSCSYTVSRKRIHLIIDALSGLDKNIKINWTHLGGGPELENLKKQAAEKLPENIEYQFSGMVSNEDVIKFYAEHEVDLFINVSENEGVPVSIMEAFSFGVPAIATDVGGVVELVNERNGFLIDKDSDAIIIASTIRQYIDASIEDKKALSENAFDTWNTKYNASVNYKQFCEIISV
jgi:glycosyltransferase involved in cell wall biosynthesis